MGVTTVIKDYGTDLLNAIRENDLAKFKSILEKQLKSEKKIQKLCVSDIKHKPTKKFACPLILAARQDDPRILKYMMDRGCDPNFIHHTIYSSKRKEIVTALHISVDLGLYDSVQILLDANADCNLVDHNQETPLHIGVKKADRILVRMLLSRGADPSLLDRRGNGALHIATLYGHLQLVQTLLKYDADIYQRGQSGAIPPHIAAKEGHIHLIQLFCLRDAGNINIKIPCYSDRREKALLHLAAENGHVETVRALIDQFDAEVNLKDSDGNTPLHCIVLNQYNPHRMRDKDDFTESARMLLKARVAINEKNVYGDTALHLAAMNQFQRIVELLLAVGADPLLANDEHLKPLDVVPDFDPVTKQLLKNAMLAPRPQISASLDSLRRGYNLSPTASETQSIRRGHGIGQFYGSDARLDKHGNMDTMSFMSESSMSMASVFDDQGSRVIGPPQPHKSAHSMAKEQDSDQSRSSKSKSQDSVEEDSVYNEIHQADTLPIYTRPNKDKKKKKDPVPQQHHQPPPQQPPPAPPKQAPVMRQKESQRKKEPQIAIFEDRTSVVSDTSYIHDPGKVANELSKILQKNKMQMATYDEEDEEDDDVSVLTSVQDTESEYMSLEQDQKKERPRPVPRARSRTSSKASSARQTPIMMDRTLETHQESPQERIYENINVLPKSRKPLPKLPTEVPFQQQMQHQQMQEQMQQFQLQQQLQQLQLQQGGSGQKPMYDVAQGNLPPGMKVNQVQGKPGTIELQYGGGPITISLDTHGSNFSLQQYEDGQSYLVSDDGQYQYSITDMIQQHNDAQNSSTQFVPGFEGGDLSADLDDTEFESNSMISAADTPQEAVRQAIQQKVAELTEHRHGDAQNPDLSEILQQQLTPTKQARKPRKATPARPQLQKNQHQQQVESSRAEEEDDVSPDESPNASPKYKNFQQALAFAKNQQAELRLQQQQERERLEDEQRKQQAELEEYLAHQHDQLEQQQTFQVKKAQKQQQQLQKLIGNKAPLISSPQSQRWQSKQVSETVVVEQKQEVPRREVQRRVKPDQQSQQNRREPRATSQYMSSAFPSSSIEDIEVSDSEEEEEEEDDNEATEDRHPDQVQYRPQLVQKSQQQSHDYYSITPGLDKHEPTQRAQQQFVIEPAPSNQVSESHSSKYFSSGNLIKANRDLQGQVGNKVFEQNDDSHNYPIKQAVSEELLQEYEDEPGSHRLRAKSEELLRSPKQARTNAMSPSRSVGARTPDSLWSVGSNGSGLNMRVTGEMPKAYTRATKHSARTAFIKAPPQGIESSSECSDVEYHTSPPRENAIREMFVKSPTPIITDCVSPTSQLSTSPPSSSSPPEGESRKGKKGKKKLIGAPIPKPYQSFGKIEPKIDALLEALSENEQGLSDYDIDDDDVLEPAEEIREQQMSPPDFDIPAMKGSPKAIRPRPALAKPAPKERGKHPSAEMQQESVSPVMHEGRITITSTASVHQQYITSDETQDVPQETQNSEEVEESLAKSPFKRNIKVKEDGPETYEAISAAQIPFMKGSPKAIRPRPALKPQQKGKASIEGNITEVVPAQATSEPGVIEQLKTSVASVRQNFVETGETHAVNEEIPDTEEVGQTLAKSSFKKNIKVKEDGPETYEAVAASQVVKSPTRKKTVTVKEQRWQGENVIETLTTTVVADQVPAASQVTVAEIVNSSQDEASTSSSGDSQSSADEGTYGAEYDAERATIKRKPIGQATPLILAMQEQQKKLKAKYESDDIDEDPIILQKDLQSSNQVIIQQEKIVDDDSAADDLFKQQMKKQANALSEKQGWGKRSSQEIKADITQVPGSKPHNAGAVETNIDADIEQTQEFEREPFRKPRQKLSVSVEGPHNISTQMADEEVAFLSAVAEEKKAGKRPKKKSVPGAATHHDPQLVISEEQLADQDIPQTSEPPTQPQQKPARVQGRAAARKQQQQQQRDQELAAQQQKEQQAQHLQQQEELQQQHPQQSQKTLAAEQQNQEVTGKDSYARPDQLMVETAYQEEPQKSQLLPAGFVQEKTKKKGGFWSLSSMRKKKDKGIKGSQSKENLADESGETVNRATTPENKPKKKGLFGKKKGDKGLDTSFSENEEVIGVVKETPVTPDVHHHAITPEKEYPESPESTPRSPEGFEGTVMGAASGSQLERSDTVKEQKEVKKAGFFKMGSMRTKKKKKDKTGPEFGAVPYNGTENAKMQNQQIPQGGNQGSPQQQYPAVGQHKEHVPPPPGPLHRDARTPSETNLDDVLAQQQNRNHQKPQPPHPPHHGSMETNLDDIMAAQQPVQPARYTNQAPADFQNAAFAALTGNGGTKPHPQTQGQPMRGPGQNHMGGGGDDLMSQLWSDQQKKQAIPPPVQQSEQIPPDAQYEQQPKPTDIEFGQAGAHPRGRRYFKKHERPLQPIKHINKSLEDVAFAHMKTNLADNGNNNFRRSKSTDELEDRHPSVRGEHPSTVVKQRLPSAASRYGPWQGQQNKDLPPRPILPSQGSENGQGKIDDTENVAKMWKENQDHKAEMQQILQSVSDVAMVTTEDALRYEGQSDDGSSVHSESATPIFWGSSVPANKDKSQEELANLATAAGLGDIVADMKMEGTKDEDEKMKEDQLSQACDLPKNDEPTSIEEAMKTDDDTVSVDTAIEVVTITQTIKEDTSEAINKVQADRQNAPSPKPAVPQKPKNLKWGTGVKPKIAAKPAGLKQAVIPPKTEQSEMKVEQEPTPAEIYEGSSPVSGKKPARPELKSRSPKPSWLSEGPVEADQGQLTVSIKDEGGIRNVPSSGPMVVDMDTYVGDRPTGTDFHERSSPEKIKRKKAKKPNEDMKYKEAMSDTEAVPSRSRKRKSIGFEGDIYSDAEAMDMEPPTRDPGKSLQDAALESITSDLENRPKPRAARKPWWQESDKPINYTRGVYRPPPVHFRPSTGDNEGGSYIDSQIKTWGDRNRSYADSEGEADVEEYAQDTSYDTGSFPRQQPQQNRYSAYSVKSDDSVFVPVEPAQVSPAHSSVSSNKKVTIVEGKKGRRKGRKRDKPPSIMEPGPIDFSQYPVTARLWMEQVDKKTVQKSKTMSFMVMPEGVLPPEELRNNLPPYVPSSDDVFLPPQWVIARGRSLRKRSKRSSSATSLGRSDSDIETSPDRPMSPGRQMLLFFRVGSNWRDLAWILFDGIYSEAETLKLIKDIQLRNPGELTLQVRDLMHRWWKKKRSEATIEELQRALDIVNLGYIHEEFFDQKNSLTSFTDTEDDLDISEVSDTDPDVSRLMGEYEVRSMNSSFELENAPERPYAIPPEQMMARLRQKGMLRASESSLGRRSTSSSYRGQDSSHDSLLDDGKGKFLIVTPQLKHENYRHETTI